jgi:hypothetical protein
VPKRIAEKSIHPWRWRRPRGRLLASSIGGCKNGRNTGVGDHGTSGVLENDVHIVESRSESFRVRPRNGRGGSTQSHDGFQSLPTCSGAFRLGRADPDGTVPAAATRDPSDVKLPVAADGKHVGLTIDSILR